jgi:hypothetical protein
MYSANINIKGALEDFSFKNTTFPYHDFVPRLYNFCRSLDFEPGKILPSRAFCSDENQGYPNLLIAKHFGTFPFNHGMVGGIVDTDRHGPHSEHGKDLVIIHASHVGYDPVNGSFGNYHRRLTEHFETTASCGKIDIVLEWYLTQYAFAKENIFLHRHDNELLVTIDNQILNENMIEGLFLQLDRILKVENQGGGFRPRRAYSTSKCYAASAELCQLLGETAWPDNGRQPIGEKLLPELFGFKRHISGDTETRGLLEENLAPLMTWIVSSKFPLLTAAQANTQAEFDRTYRTLLNSRVYIGKRVVFISGLNIDISPHKSQAFPSTTFVPWAAFVQKINGHNTVLEQKDIVNRLLEQSEDNPDEFNLQNTIQQRKDTEEISIKFPA